MVCIGLENDVRLPPVDGEHPDERLKRTGAGAPFTQGQIGNSASLPRR
jgi:hypothetical protein